MARRLGGEVSDELGLLRRQQSDFKKQLVEERRKNAELLDMVGDKAVFKYTVDNTLHTDLKRQIQANASLLTELKRKELELDEVRAKSVQQEEQVSQLTHRNKEQARTLQERMETSNYLESQNEALRQHAEDLSADLQHYKTENERLLDSLKSVKKQFEATTTQKLAAEQVLLEVKREVVAAKQEFSKEKRVSQMKQLKQKVLFVADILDLFLTSRTKLHLAQGFFGLKEFSQRHLLIKKTLLVGFNLLREKVKANAHKCFKIWKLNTDRNLLQSIARREQAFRELRGQLLLWQARAKDKTFRAQRTKLLKRAVVTSAHSRMKKALSSWRLRTAQTHSLRAVGFSVALKLKYLRRVAFDSVRLHAVVDLQQSMFETELGEQQTALRQLQSKTMAFFMIDCYSKLQRHHRAVEERVRAIEGSVHSSAETQVLSALWRRFEGMYKNTLKGALTCIAAKSLNSRWEQRLEMSGVALLEVVLCNQTKALKAVFFQSYREAARHTARLTSALQLLSQLQTKVSLASLGQWRLVVVQMQNDEKDLEHQVVLEDAQDDVRRLTKKLLLLNAEVKQLKEQLAVSRTQTADGASLARALKQLADERESLATELASRSFSVKKLLDENQSLGLRLKNAQLEAEQLVLLSKG
jgi:hypothetical protein